MDNQSKNVRELSINLTVVSGIVCAVASPFAIIMTCSASRPYSIYWIGGAVLLACSGAYYVWKGLRELLAARPHPLKKP